MDDPIEHIQILKEIDMSAGMKEIVNEFFDTLIEMKRIDQKATALFSMIENRLKLEKPKLKQVVDQMCEIIKKREQAARPNDN